MKKYTTVLLTILTVFAAATAGTVSAVENVSNGTLTCNVTGTSYECASWSGEQYPVTDLFGEEYVPLFTPDGNVWESHVNKLARLILDSNETHTLKPGENIYLGSGYALEVREIDIDREKVWLELMRDGEYIANKSVSIDTDENRTWAVTLDNVQGENNIVIMKVHVKNLFVGTETSVVWIDGVWLIDYANARTLNIGDKLGEFTLEQVISGVDAFYPGSLVFKNTTIDDDLQSYNLSVSSSPEKEQTTVTYKTAGFSNSWYWNFWRFITMKSR